MSNAQNETELRSIPLASIDIHPNKLRAQHDEAELETLATSLLRHGLIEPVLVRPIGERYQLIAGERRYQAAGRAGWREIPATVRELDDAETLIVMLVENLHRKDLDMIELARGLQQLAKPVSEGGTGKSHGEIARTFGRTRTWSSHLVRLLSLPEHWQQKVARGELSWTNATILCPLRDQPAVLQAIEEDMRRSPWPRSNDYFRDRVHQMLDSFGFGESPAPGRPRQASPTSLPTPPVRPSFPGPQSRAEEAAVDVTLPAMAMGDFTPRRSKRIPAHLRPIVGLLRRVRTIDELEAVQRAVNARRQQLTADQPAMSSS